MITLELTEEQAEQMIDALETALDQMIYVDTHNRVQALIDLVEQATTGTGER